MKKYLSYYTDSMKESDIGDYYLASDVDAEIARLNRIITAQAAGYDALLQAAEWIGVDDEDFERCTRAYEQERARALAEGKG